MKDHGRALATAALHTGPDLFNIVHETEGSGLCPGQTFP